MAGEWIAVDLSLPEKPEFQEIMDISGRTEHEVQFWLIRLWGWASMHCADGTARMTMPRMVRTWGADEAFWRAVAAVGWLEIDETAATVAVPGWDRRFSQAAKARLQHRDRAAAQEDKRGRLRSSAGTPCAQAQERRGEERRSSSSSAREESPPDGASWAILRDAWNAGAVPEARRKPWKPAEPPAEALERLSEPGWLPDALKAVGRLAVCRYFKTPVGLPQFCGDVFVRKVLEGRYDDVNEPKAPRAGPDDKPPPKVDPAFAAAAAATREREERRRAEEHARLDEAVGETEIEDARRLVRAKIRQGATP